MKPMPWIKQPTTLLNNVALLQLSERAQLRYFQLYLLAGYLNANGAMMQDGKKLKESEIAHLLRVRDAAQLAKDIKSMKQLGLIRVNGHGIEIAAFKDDQGDYLKKLQDTRERQKRFKSKKDNALPTRDDGVSNALVTPLEKEEEAESESETESTSLLLSAALQKFGEGKFKPLTENEQHALAEILPDLKPDWLTKAIRLASTKRKTSPSYVIGILKNWRMEHANSGNRNNTNPKQKRTAPPAEQPAPAKSAATRAAAKRALANKQHPMP